MGWWAGSSSAPPIWTPDVPEIRVSASSIVGAPAAVVYGILADYHHGHPAILQVRLAGSGLAQAGPDPAVSVRP